MVVIGIDPGISGALALVDHGKRLVHLHDMPVMARGAGTATVKNQVAPSALAQLLAQMTGGLDKNEILVLIEAVAAMPKQGVATMFSLGHTAGIIEGVVAARGYPHRLVTPAQWKKAMGIIMPKGADKGHAKNIALKEASRLYPEADLHRVKDHNRAEAVLIARYGIDREA